MSLNFTLVRERKEKVIAEQNLLLPNLSIDMYDLMKLQTYIKAITKRLMADDPFGYITNLSLKYFFDPDKLEVVVIRWVRYKVIVAKIGTVILVLEKTMLVYTNIVC